MKALVSLICFVTFVTACAKNSASTPAPAPGPGSPQKPLNSVATKIVEFQGVQVTGVAASMDGRLFANFPRWRENLPFSVVEIAADGSYKPYPDSSWNDGKGVGEINKFNCVQSMLVHEGFLYILDPSNPVMKGVVGKPTLYKFDLATNRLAQKWEFDSRIAPSRSYLNDLRIEAGKPMVYMTESGLGAIVTLNMQTGETRRLLDKRPSTKAEPIVLNVGGKPFVKRSGVPQRFHSDGIALREGYLYYHALTAYHLYRVPTRVLDNANLSEDQVAAAVEDLGMTPAPDGMIFDRTGNLFFADLEKNAVVFRSPAGEIKTFLQDPALHWADTFTLDANENLVFTDSHLDEAIPGKPAAGVTFTIYRATLPK